MSEEGAVVESQDEGSSDDLRTAIQTSMREANERARDEGGRFAKTETVEEPAPATATPRAASESAPVEQAAPVEAAALQAAATPAEPASSVKPPDAWSPAAKAQFATLPAEIQAEIARRESEVHKGFTKQDEQRTVGKQFQEAITPYLPLIRSEGGDPIRAVQDLLQTAYVLRTAAPQQKQDLFLSLANQFGVDLNQISQRVAGGQSQGDPQVAQLRNELQQLQWERQQAEQQRQAQEQMQLNQTIEQFAADPKNLYFPNVRVHMGALMRAGAASSLQDAYDQACRAHPEISRILLQQAEASAEQQRLAAAREKAERARAASGSITGSPTGAVTNSSVNQNGSLADDIRAAFRDVNSRNAA